MSFNVTESIATTATDPSKNCVRDFSEVSPVCLGTFASQSIALYSVTYSTSTIIVSGVHENTLRYFDPELGRYLSRDPIWENGGVMLYGFCANDSISFVDMMGLKVYVLISSEYIRSQATEGGGWQEFMEPGVSEEAAKRSAEYYYRQKLLNDVKRVALNVEKEQGLSTLKKAELMPEGYIVTSINDIKKYAEQGKPNEDHFILLAHSQRQRESDSVSKWIYIGKDKEQWGSQTIDDMFAAFKDHCLDLTLYVCHVGKDSAKKISEQIGGKNVFYKPGQVDYPRIPNFSIILKGSESDFDPTKTGTEPPLDIYPNTKR